MPASPKSSSQELFAQELFAHELVSRRADGGRASAEPARGAKLQIAQMEMQYLDAQCGAPTLVTAGTPIASARSSDAHMTTVVGAPLSCESHVLLLNTRGGTR